MAVLPYSNPVVVNLSDHTLPYSDPVVVHMVPLPEEWFVITGGVWTPATLTSAE